MSVAMITPAEGMKRLAYFFGRLGRCIKSGGRRQLRMELQATHKLHKPDREGRQTAKGSFKEIITAMKMISREELRNHYGKREKAKQRSGAPDGIRVSGTVDCNAADGTKG